MQFSLNSNVLSSGLRRQLALSSGALEVTLRRLASGSRINSASDDAAGLAIASVLNSSSRVFAQGIRNANDAVSLLNVSQGGLGQLTNILQRVKELATQSANGSFSRIQRISLDQEALQLSNEFNRITASAQFNGRSVFAADFGTLRIQLGFGTDESLALNLNSELSSAKGLGTFSESATVSSVPSPFDASAVGDFNGDGNQDVVVASSSIPASISVALGNGNGTFRSTQDLGSYYAALSATSEVATGDIDGDGDTDIIAVDGSNVYGVYRNNGAGSFTVSQTFTGSGRTAVTLEDIDGDGAADLLYGQGSNLYVQRAIGNGTFQTGISSYGVTASVFRDIAVGDVNNDGKSDIMVATSGAGSALNLFLGVGGGAFSAGTTFGNGANTSVELADMNHDGILDVVAGRNPSQINIYMGNGDGTFGAAQTTTISGSGNVFLRTGDFNGDGLTDILAGTSGGTTAQMFYGLGDGTLDTRGTFSAQFDYQFETADFNNDGALDIFFFDNNSTHRVFLQETEQATSIARFDLTTRESSLEALELVDAILQKVQRELGAIGALQSRVNTAIENLQSRRLGYDAGAGRIVDMDVAAETSQLTKFQILQRTSTALLAQANAAPGILLDILRDSGTGRR